MTLMNTLFLDCFSGISGDMMVGALCDLGVKPSTFEWELSKLEIGDFHMHFERGERQHVEGMRFSIHGGAVHVHEPEEEEGHAHAHDHGAHDHDHDHDHEHDAPETGGGDEHLHDLEHGDELQNAHARHAEEHAHSHARQLEEHGHDHDQHHEDEHAHVHGRTHREIRELISKSDLSPFVKKHSLGMFQRIAVAEGKIHGMPPEDVQFHEVGALDSIADIVLVCVGLEALGVSEVHVSHLQDGHGWVKCAHGRYPVPTVATLEILKGIPVAQTDEPHELITPTGAAILAEFGASFGLMPRMCADHIGYGLGTRKLRSRPNVLRAVLGTSAADSGRGWAKDEIARLETNLDDLSPEIVAFVAEELFSLGALDVYLTPIQMKKGRPGVMLTALCDEAAAPRLVDAILLHTTSFGVRMERVERWKLDRRIDRVMTSCGEIEVKIGLRGEEVVQVAPEFESCRVAAGKSSRGLRAVYDEAVKAWRDLNP